MSLWVYKKNILLTGCLYFVFSAKCKKEWQKELFTSFCKILLEYYKFPTYCYSFKNTIKLSFKIILIWILSVRLCQENATKLDTKHFITIFHTFFNSEFLLFLILRMCLSLTLFFCNSSKISNFFCRCRQIFIYLMSF